MDNYPNHPHGPAHLKFAVRHHQCFPRRHASNCKTTRDRHAHPSSTTPSSSSSSSSSSSQTPSSASKGSMCPGGGGGGRLKSANLGLSHSTSAKCFRFRYGQSKIDYSVRSGSAKTSLKSRCGLRRGTTCFFLSSTVDHSDRNSGKRRTVKRCKFLGTGVEGSPLISTSESPLRGGIGPALFYGLAVVDGTHPEPQSQSSFVRQKIPTSESNVIRKLENASYESYSQNNKSSMYEEEEVCSNSSSKLCQHFSTIHRMWNKSEALELEENKLEIITLPPKVLVPLWMQNLNSNSTK